MRARKAVDAGFRAIKTKMGYPTLAQDLEVLRALRNAVGADVHIMVDYNQGLTVPEAERRIRALAQEGVAWVEEPNTLGMALFALGGRMTSKPYIASGAYIKRMSNHCKGCAYKPELRTGPKACPFTTFYWDFLMRHETRFRSNPRMAMAYKNLDRMDPEERSAIRAWAQVRLDSMETL